MTSLILPRDFVGKPLLHFRTVLKFFLLCVKPSPDFSDTCHPYTTPHTNFTRPFLNFVCTFTAAQGTLDCNSLSAFVFHLVECDVLICPSVEHSHGQFPTLEGYGRYVSSSWHTSWGKKWMYSNSGCTCFPPHFPPTCLSPEEIWVWHTSYSVLWNQNDWIQLQRKSIKHLNITNCMSKRLGMWVR